MDVFSVAQVYSLRSNVKFAIYITLFGIKTDLSLCYESKRRLGFIPKLFDYFGLLQFLFLRPCLLSFLRTLGLRWSGGVRLRSRVHT